MTTFAYEMDPPFAALVERATDGDGDVDDGLRQLVATDAASDAADEACRRAFVERRGAQLVHALRALESDRDIYDAEIARLTVRRRVAANQVERVRDFIKRSMRDAGVTKIKAGTFSISLSDGPERVDIIDADQVPHDFTRVKREIDKTAILDAHRAYGECVPGTSISRALTLRIR